MLQKPFQGDAQKKNENRKAWHRARQLCKRIFSKRRLGFKAGIGAVEGASGSADVEFFPEGIFSGLKAPASKPSPETHITEGAFSVMQATPLLNGDVSSLVFDITVIQKGLEIIGSNGLPEHIERLIRIRRGTYACNDDGLQGKLAGIDDMIIHALSGITERHLDESMRQLSRIIGSLKEDDDDLQWYVIKAVGLSAKRMCGSPEFGGFMDSFSSMGKHLSHFHVRGLYVDTLRVLSVDE